MINKKRGVILIIILISLIILLPKFTLATNTKTTGEHPVLVILLNFTDVNPITTPEKWYERIFGSTGSLKDYFNEVSEGLLDLIPAQETSGTTNDGIVGWYQTGKNLSNYMSQCNDPDNKNTDCKELIRKAVSLASENINFKKFDINNNNYISSEELHVIIVAAGYDQSVNWGVTGQTSFWRHHSFFLANENPPSTGVTLFVYGGGYMAIGEKIRGYDTSPIGMGFIAHEMGHDLGFADLYDRDESSEGIGSFGLMGSGDRLPEIKGTGPAYPSAYHRLKAGWINTDINNKLKVVNQELPSASILTASSLSNGIEIYQLPTSNGREYFLVENRRKISSSLYDRLPGNSGGLLIWHIDLTRAPFLWNDDESRKLVDLEEADGNEGLNKYGYIGNANDFWYSDNGEIKKKPPAFNSTSIPNSKLYDALESGIIVKDISQRSDLMTATFEISTAGQVGRTSETKLFIITNSGGSPLKITSMDTGNFTWMNISETSFPITIPAGGSKTIYVTAKSTGCSGSGKKEGYIRIESDAQNKNPVSYKITMICTEFSSAQTSSGAEILTYNFTQPSLILSDYIRIPKNATIRYATMQIREVYE